jgi:hypothetical protein
MYGSKEYNQQFQMILTVGKGTVRIHKHVNQKKKEFLGNMLIALSKAREGYEIDVLPTLHPKDENRNIIFYDAKPNKNPDLRIDGILWEVEHPRKPGKLNTLRHRISDGAKQADHVLVILDTVIDINLMRRTCKGRFIDNSRLEVVEFRYKETSVIFKRDDFDYTKKEPLH